MQVNGDAWEWVWDRFLSVTMHSNGTLPLPLTLPLGVGIALESYLTVNKYYSLVLGSIHTFK